MYKKMNGFVLAAVVSAVTLSLAGCTGSAAVPDVVKIQAAEQNVIRVSATEQVKVVPDIADVEFGVRTEGEDATRCQTLNASESNRVIELLKNSGIPETSIQTNGYSLNPRYDWSDDKQVLTGYEMTTNITVSELPLEQVGKLLGDAVNSGINYISSVNYRCSSYDENYQEALKLAIEAARTKAEAMAAAGKGTLGPVVGMEELSSNQEVRYANYAAGAQKDMAVERAVMPGEMDVEAVVLVEFELR